MADRAFYAKCSTPQTTPNARIGAAVEGTDGVFLQDLDPKPNRLSENGKYKKDDEAHVQQFSDNIARYLDGEVLKYAIDHAVQLGLDETKTKEYEKAIVKLTMTRADLLYREPNYMFLVEMAGCLRARVETLYESLPEAENRDLIAHIRDIAKEISEGRAFSYESHDIERMLKSYAIGGHIRVLPKVTAAKNKVMMELKQKNGCSQIRSFDKLIEIESVRSFLAELCAYQLMLWNQIDAKRDYKVSDYRRVLDLHRDTWTRFVVLLQKTPNTGVVQQRSHRPYAVRSFGVRYAGEASFDEWNRQQMPYSWNIRKSR